MTLTAEAGKGRSSREAAPPAARETPPLICYPDVVSDRPYIDNDAADDLDASCDLAEFEVREVSPQRTATRLLRESSRVEAFSDGVFAIAITLLVLTLAAPTYEKAASAPELRRALLEQWPTYVAFVMSFLSILIMWASHHNIFSLIRRVDHVFLLLNGLVLMGVTLIPFPTQLLASHLGHPGEGVAAEVYCVIALFISLAYNALWYWARRGGHLLEPDASPQTLRAVTRQYAVAPVVYLVALGSALVNVWPSIAIFVGASVYYAIPTRATVPLGEDPGEDDPADLAA
jgi:uncharacterized membrane protein